jgi:hypothetical protein
MRDMMWPTPRAAVGSRRAAGMLLAAVLFIQTGCREAASPTAPELPSSAAAARAEIGAACIQFLTQIDRGDPLTKVGSRKCRTGADGFELAFQPFGLIQFLRDGIELSNGAYGDRDNNGFVAHWTNGFQLRDFTFTWTTEGIPTDQGNIPLWQIEQANGLIFNAYRMRRVQFTLDGQPFGEPIAIPHDRHQRAYVIILSYVAPDKL